MFLSNRGWSNSIVHACKGNTLEPERLLLEYTFRGYGIEQSSFKVYGRLILHGYGHGIISLARALVLEACDGVGVALGRWVNWVHTRLELVGV